MKQILILLVVTLCGCLLSTSALAADADDLYAAMQGQNPEDFLSSYRPIAPWTGQIILPRADARVADGSVPFLVYTCPQPELIGRIIRLTWNSNDAAEDWFFKARPDVIFDKKKQEIGEKAGCRFPTQLEGWKGVSALESLPANRSEGTIEVMLKHPVFQNGRVYISQEPVQVNGAWTCLARFEGPQDGNLRRIRHYNQQTRQFDGPSEVVTILPRRVSDAKGPPQTSLDGIENTRANAQGWYLFGKRIRTGFLAKAIEPRDALRIKPDQVMATTPRVSEYAENRLFEALTPGLSRVTMFEPRDSQSGIPNPLDLFGYASRVWPVGTRALVIHLFGWRRVLDQKPGLMDLAGITTGHFAFGFAEVIADPFTGEPRWNIEYKQVYGHNREEVVSGSIAWHAYMGNLWRGWMYALPVSDTMIQIPELQSYVIGSWKINPMRGLARELERMMALYRVGGGSGCATIRPDVSCVQDSHCALYAALDGFVRSVGSRPETRQWLEASAGDTGDRGRFQRLSSLAEEVRKMISSPFGAQGNWREFVDNPLGTREPLQARTVLDLLLGARTVFPRFAYHRLLKLAVDRQYPMWNILTVQIGGHIPGIEPQKPTSPTKR